MEWNGMELILLHLLQVYSKRGYRIVVPFPQPPRSSSFRQGLLGSELGCFPNRTCPEKSKTPFGIIDHRNPNDYIEVDQEALALHQP